ncbi:MAG TPA: dihydroorotase [Candidatus Baltobacteraceae bacterium]|jgi:dihydroorotase
MLLRGGRVVDPSQGIDARLDVRLRDGRIAEIGEHLAPEAGEETYDAGGAYVAPGFIDMHVHLREPGQLEKETIATGSAAAVAGGFTAVACMPNTQPALDDPATIAELVRTIREYARCRVYPIAAITRGRAGIETLDYAALAKAGAVAFSDDGSTIGNARVLRDAARAAANVPGCFISHCEDDHLKGDAVMHEGSVSRALGVSGSPGVAEDIVVARDLLIAADTGKAWHIAHLSTSRAVEVVRALRSRGVSATCEVTPHHLILTDECVRTLGSGAKVNPPLRGAADTRALADAVRDGTIDVFATDHAPHTDAEKRAPLDCGAVGFSGLEIAVGAFALAVADLPIARYVELLSVNPARILGVEGGTLRIGSTADITVFADRDWIVDPAKFASKGKSTPFAGMRLPRRALATIVAGKLAYRHSSSGGIRAEAP